MMPNRRHDDVVDQLDQFYMQAKRQILSHQSAITGLFPRTPLERKDAYIRDSIFCASGIWALYLAYTKRVDNDYGKAHDLGQSVVKCMRGILFAWMRQSEEKVELFKANQSPKHALHLKFNLNTGLANDPDYPHLQTSVVSLYLLFLSQMISSGLQIIYTMDEVTFIQNLVYYVERAYRTPDYGHWEQSAQFPSHLNYNYQNSSNVQAQDLANPSATNQHQQQQTRNNESNNTNNDNNNSNNNSVNQHQANQQTTRQPVMLGAEDDSLEIHATSIGMAKSALEAINGCNLFGEKGANWSIIYSDIDAHSRNRSIFETLLPRESKTKNTDSFLLATISWPCFATHDESLYQATKSKILRKLKGRYGLRRFLRDPYGTVVEDSAFSQAANQPQNVQHQHQQQQQQSDSLSQQDLLASIIQHQQRAHVVYNQGPHSQHHFAQPSGAQSQSTSKLTSTLSNQCDNNNLTNNSSPPTTTTTPTNFTKARKSSFIKRNLLRASSYQSYDSLTIDANSLHSISKKYEHIESEWPLFVCFLIIDGIFKQDMEQIYENERLLYERLIKVESKFGDYLMPKYYYVPQELINSEKCKPDSVERLASIEGSSPEHSFLMGQAVLLVTRLLLSGLLTPTELDPCKRHMARHDKPKKVERYSTFQAKSPDLVVQTVLIAESIRLQAMMANYGIQTQTPLEVEPVQIWSSSQLVKVYEYLGINEKLGLKGRPARPIGALGTSKLYRICGQTILCYPLIFEVSDFYLAQDMLLLIDDIQNELNFIGRYWRMAGRPTVCILIREDHLKDVHFRDLLDLLVQFKNGQLKRSGLHIKTGRLQNLISSSCIEHLDFLHALPHERFANFQAFKQVAVCSTKSLMTTPHRILTSDHDQAQQHNDDDDVYVDDDDEYDGDNDNDNNDKINDDDNKNNNNSDNNNDNNNKDIRNQRDNYNQRQQTKIKVHGVKGSFRRKNQAPLLSPPSINSQLLTNQQNKIITNIRNSQQQGSSSSSSRSLASSRQHLASASSNNLQAINELNSSISLSSSQDDDGCGGGGGGQTELVKHNNNLHASSITVATLALKSAQRHFSHKSERHLFDLTQRSSDSNLNYYSNEAMQKTNIDYYERYKDSTQQTRLELFRNCNELHAQAQLLTIFRDREGAKHVIDGLTVDERLERLSAQACQHRNWSAVRYCSSVLKRSVESLSPWLTSILVNGKQISLGTGNKETIINNPLTPIEINQLIHSTLDLRNPCDSVLQQEIALYIGRLISTRPDFFEGILTIRVGNFMSAMRSYLAIKASQRQQVLREIQRQKFVRYQDFVYQRQASAEPQQQSLDLSRKTRIDIAATSASNVSSELDDADVELQSFRTDNNNYVNENNSNIDATINDYLPTDLSLNSASKSKQAQQQQQSNASSSSSSSKRNSSLNDNQSDKLNFKTSSDFSEDLETKLAATEQFNQFCDEQTLAPKPLESLSPSEVRKLLLKVLTDDPSLPISDRRHITGQLCRVPRDFYDKVWSLLSRTNVGIVIGGKILRSLSTLTNMTQDDLNFALKVEALLNIIECPKLRQINVELLMTLYVILQRNPEIRFNSEPLDIDKIINLSLKKFRSDYNRDDYGLKEYYTKSERTTMLYTYRCLLDNCVWKTTTPPPPPLSTPTTITTATATTAPTTTTTSTTKLNPLN